MNFSKDLKSNMEKIDTIYDLIAYCYCYILKNINNPIIFLGQYIYTNEKGMKNPNLKELNRFSMSLKERISENPMNLFDDDIRGNELINIIENEENRLKKFGKMAENRATIPFYILLGVDLYLGDKEYAPYEKAPLNEHFKRKCLIYLNTKESIMDQVELKREYPNLIVENKIKYCFRNIIIIERKEIPQSYGIPQLVTLYKEKNELNKIIQGNKIKVAFIPVLNEKWFEFCLSEGACFHIKYDIEKLIQIKNRITKLLMNAIDNGANIIVFPEYVCKEEVQAAIRDVLRRKNNEEPERLNKLLFVVAGTGWTQDSNNVSRIFGYDGSDLGKMYKYSAYDNTDKNGNKLMEKLKNPGKEITLVKIPGIGICQIDICRDVSENVFCMQLAKTFKSQFLLISAWSSSVNIGFKGQLQSIAEATHRTCAGMANCCAAVDSSREDIGVAVVPQKEVSNIVGRHNYITRYNEICEKTCQTGCFFEVCYDFDGDDKQDIIVSILFKNSLK